MAPCTPWAAQPVCIAGVPVQLQALQFAPTSELGRTRHLLRVAWPSQAVAWLERMKEPDLEHFQTVAHGFARQGQAWCGSEFVEGAFRDRTGRT